MNSFTISINFSKHIIIIATVECKAGTYRDDKAISCTKCPENKVAEKDGATICTSCPAGKVPNVERSSCGD